MCRIGHQSEHEPLKGYVYLFLFGETPGKRVNNTGNVRAPIERTTYYNFSGFPQTNKKPSISKRDPTTSLRRNLRYLNEEATDIGCHYDCDIHDRFML